MTSKPRARERAAMTPDDDLELPEEPNTQGLSDLGARKAYADWAIALLSLARKLKERLAEITEDRDAMIEHYNKAATDANEAERKLAEAEQRAGKK